MVAMGLLMLLLSFCVRCRLRKSLFMSFTFLFLGLFGFAFFMIGLTT
jgi:hypothetical protein